MEKRETFSGLLVWVLRGSIVVAACWSAFGAWKNLREYPRTEDAEVRANLAGIAPQVGGSIVGIHVADNQFVKQGSLLFELDARPYEAEAARAKARFDLVRMEVAALQDQILAAEASLGEKVAAAEYAVAHSERLEQLLKGQFVSPDRVQRAQSEARVAAAAVREAGAAVAKAKNQLGEFEGKNTRIEEAAAALRDAELKVSYCKVYAPCDGIVTDLQIAAGSYAAAGEQIFSLVDLREWFVLANFRETDLERVKPGQKARVFLMADRAVAVEGIVQGIPRAVFPMLTPSRSAAGGEGVLSRVKPTFDFVQLAQRFPVRILLEGKERAAFRMGGRAAVIIDTKSQPVEVLQAGEKKVFLPPEMR